VGFICDGQEAEYRELVDHFVARCGDNHLEYKQDFGFLEKLFFYPGRRGGGKMRALMK